MTICLIGKEKQTVVLTIEFLFDIVFIYQISDFLSC